MRRELCWLPVAVLGVMLPMLATSIILRRPTPELPRVRNVYLVGTPTAVGYTTGLSIWSLVSPPTRFADEELQWFEFYWPNLQPDLTSTPDWSAVDARIAANTTADLYADDFLVHQTS